MMTRIAIIGNTGWQNKRKVQDTLQKLKSQFSDDLKTGGYIRLIHIYNKVI